MRRRTFLGTALAVANATPLFAALRGGRWDEAAAVLERAVAAKQVDAAVLHVQQNDESLTRPFGTAASGDAMFLLGSISKPINVAAVMTLSDQGKVRLDDRVKTFLPAFTGDGRGKTHIRSDTVRRARAEGPAGLGSGSSRAPRRRARRTRS